MDSNTDTIRNKMRTMIESRSTDSLREMLEQTIKQMNQTADHKERATIGVVYIMIAEALEARIGWAAVEAIEDSLFTY